MNPTEYFYFDIETSGAYRDIHTMYTKTPEMYKLFIHKMERMREKDPAMKDSNIVPLYPMKAPLFPEFGRIVCFSYAYFDNDNLYLDSVQNPDEEQLIHGILDVINTIVIPKNLKLCGYNIKGFDIPYLFKKFLHYKMTPPACVNFFNKKPWEVECLDLMELWKNNSNQQIATLEEFAFALGIESPKTELSGDKVHETYYKGEHELVKKYCQQDVMCCVKCVYEIQNLV